MGVKQRICKNCVYWDDGLADYEEGECKEIRSKLEFVVMASLSGGYVEQVITEHDFGCNLFGLIEN